MTNELPFVVVGIEGTHGAGKTAVAHALVARLREEGFGPTLVPDAGRFSPFVQDRLRSEYSGVPPLLQELTLISARIKGEVEAARNHGVVICDKTVFGALAYLKLFDATTVHDPLHAAVRSLCCAYAAHMYDLVVFLDRRFDWGGDAIPDPGRYGNAEDQRRYQELLREDLAAFGTAVLRIASTGNAWETSELIVADLRRRGLV